MSKQQRVYEYDDPRELATFIVEYEFTSPQSRFKGRSELTEYYTQLIEKFGNSRELEGRIDENKMWVASYKHQIRRLFGNSYVKKSMKLAIEFFNIRVRELESQKEKTNE